MKIKTASVCYYVIINKHTNFKIIVIKGGWIFMKNIVFCFLSVVFFILYFAVFSRMWTSLVPLNATTEVISMFIFVFVNIPISLISAQTLIKIIKKN